MKRYWRRVQYPACLFNDVIIPGVEVSSYSREKGRMVVNNDGEDDVNNSGSAESADAERDAEEKHKWLSLSSPPLQTDKRRQQLKLLKISSIKSIPMITQIAVPLNSPVAQTFNQDSESDQSDQSEAVIFGRVQRRDRSPRVQRPKDFSPGDNNDLLRRPRVNSCTDYLPKNRGPSNHSMRGGSEKCPRKKNTSRARREYHRYKEQEKRKQWRRSAMVMGDKRKGAGGAILHSPSKNTKTKLYSDQEIVRWLKKNKGVEWKRLWRKLVQSIKIFREVAVAEMIMKTIFGVWSSGRISGGKYRLGMNFFGGICTNEHAKAILDFFKKNVTGTDYYCFDYKSTVWFQGLVSKAEQMETMQKMPALTFVVFMNDNKRLTYSYKDLEDGNECCYQITAYYDGVRQGFESVNIADPDSDDDVLYKSLIELNSKLQKAGFHNYEIDAS
eukprot:TRINITY_DN9947_c0_g1_i1.p1 TRINITY_DN9947_c0_g1~~TRINITY_DN9947_c0_g1_i1.p1  ORF type:complete len:442 (+),score=53.49 TRINITY_DN9947_c0_g1_i1:146-1471(+)